jgi:hypothetical protein
VGLPKTGTTYLQSLLYANPDALARQDVTVVGDHRLHYDAASEITGRRSARTGVLPDDAWDKVVRQVEKAGTGTAVLSSERYSLVKAAGARRMLRTLEPAELHVVVTVRDLVAGEPSAWQEYVKNGGTQSWPEFCADGVADPAGLRRRRRIRTVLAVWPRLLPPERVHVVLVPPPGSPRTAMWERFASVLGVDPTAMDTLEPEHRNTALDFVSTELLRRVNARDLPVPVQKSQIKKYLANGELPRRATDVAPALSGDALRLLEAENDWLAQALTDGGYHVVGDLSDLYGGRPEAPPTYDVSAEDLLEAAVDAVVLLAQRSHERGLRLRRRRTAREALAKVALLGRREDEPGDLP